MSVVFDTNIYIGYKAPRQLRGALLSVVVLHELVAGAADKMELQALRLFKVEAERAGRLLTPTNEDWWEAGRVLYALRHGLKSRAGGRTPALPAAEVQRIMRDVLIARTVRRAGAALITDNLADFKRIARFCAVRVVSGKEFFGQS
ncbi:MAG TPA: hypothetical protein VE821_12805 [Pyrinomonadaceae bacterium]|nr:hypothetical protein [Pyrinomonadaceae bacterium]